MQFWAEGSLRAPDLATIAFPAPGSIALLNGLGVQTITTDRTEPETASRRTHKIRVEFEGEEALQEDLKLYADEILERIVDLVGVIAGLGVELLGSSCGWVDEHGKGHAVVGLGEKVPGTALVFDYADQPLNLGKDERERRALRYLRRGLAQPLADERFDTLLLAALVLARDFEVDAPEPEVCAHCGNALPTRPIGDRRYLLNLANVLDGWTTEQLDRLWDLRNRLPGHGNDHLGPVARHELAEASMAAARLAYDTLNAVADDRLLDRPHPTWEVGVLSHGMELIMTYTRAEPDEE